MFERLVVRKQNPTDIPNPIDLGFLAEAMLFYGDVALVTTRSVIQQLLRACGPDTLLALLEERHLRLLVSENDTVIHTANNGTARERYDAGLAEIRPNPDSPPLSIERTIVADDFIALIGREGRGRRLARRVAGLASVTRIHPRVAEQTHIDLRDPSFVSAAALDTLRILAPEYETPQDGFFMTEKVLSTADTGSDVDSIGYSPSLGHLYVPGGGSADLSILNVPPDGKLALLGKVPTAADAHTVAFDPQTNCVFVGTPEHGAVLVIRDPFPPSQR
jgi:hypothetical protein